MSTLIVPCVGRKLINGIPRYLNRHPNGKLLLERSIEGVYAGCYQRVLVVLLKDDVERFHADEVIRRELKRYPIELVALEEMTSGPAETVYRAICAAAVTGAVVIKDADNYLKTRETPQGNFVAGLDLNTWDRDVHNLREKSFLIVNEQGNLLDIIEKQVRSDVICLGLYGFRKAEDFIMAYRQLNDGTYPITKLYVSHIISYLIGYSGRVFRYAPSGEYESWGDERHWKDLQRDHALFFVDLDHVTEDGALSAERIEKLRSLRNRGATFIGFTVADEERMRPALQQLREAGVELLRVIPNCPYSERREIIASGSELEEKTMEL